MGSARGFRHQKCCLHMGVLTGAWGSNLSPQGHTAGLRGFPHLKRGISSGLGCMSPVPKTCLRTQPERPPPPHLSDSGSPPSREQDNPFSSFFPKQPSLSPVCISIPSWSRAHPKTATTKLPFLSPPPSSTSAWFLSLSSLRNLPRSSAPKAA